MAEGARLMAKLIHSMIRVLDEEKSLAFYRTAFGLEMTERAAFDGFTLIYLRNPETTFELELTVNKNTGKSYDLGDGYGHLAISVKDIDAEQARLKASGLSPGDVKTLRLDGRLFGKFFFISDPDGYKIEVLQRGGRFE
jgi:lactoylglutathione lyase